MLLPIVVTMINIAIQLLTSLSKKLSARDICESVKQKVVASTDSDITRLEKLINQVKQSIPEQIRAELQSVKEEHARKEELFKRGQSFQEAIRK